MGLFNRKKYVLYKRPGKKDSTLGGTIRKVLFIIILLFLLLQAFRIFLVSSYSVGSESMEPSYKKENTVIVLPLLYGAKLEAFDARTPGFNTPRRGDAVVAYHPEYKAPSVWQKTIDYILRFFTFNKASYNSVFEKKVPNLISIKRIIGIPGDTIQMDDFFCYVKPKGSGSFIIETSISIREYSPVHNPLPEGWDSPILDGSMKEITLKEGEYFLANDNRSFTSDSRYWGPVPMNKIVGKIVFSY